MSQVKITKKDIALGKRIKRMRKKAELTQEQLACALFPIGDYRKSEVREIARELNFPPEIIFAFIFPA